ncbi:MAG TPA: winged helix-turn-helix domain-containing protein [Methanosarcina sp.]|nr:winged helix-turn-helix domain-containing protein [Methanosarcina sp.]
MNPNLLDLVLFSEKRKAFLLLLKEGPKNSQEILDRLQVPRTALLPQIKKLKEQSLVVHEEGVYRLSLIGEIIMEKMEPLLDTLEIFEKSENFWADRKLTPVPSHLMKRISELGDYHLMEPDLSHTFDLNPEFVNHVSNSEHIFMFLSYFHPQFPAFFLDLARKGAEISLILSDSVYLRFTEDFKQEKENLFRIENTCLFILDKKQADIPAVVVSSDKIMLLGLFNESGRFDRQYVISFEPEAIEWGKDLFEYFRDMSREVKLEKKETNGG